MISLVLLLNFSALALLVGGILSVATHKKEELGSLAIVAGMAFAVIGLILSVLLYQGVL